MNEEQDGLSDADLWEALVKQGKSPAMATALVQQRRQQQAKRAEPGVGSKVLGTIAATGRDIPGAEAAQATARAVVRGGGWKDLLQDGLSPSGIATGVGRVMGSPAYAEARNEIRAAEDAAPMAATLPARLLGGGLATAVLPGGAALKGAQYGALSGALQSDPNSGTTSRGISAGFGAGVGYLGGKYADKAVGAIGKRMRPFPPAVELQPFPKSSAAVERPEGLLSSKWDEVVEVLNARKGAPVEPPVTPRAPAPPIAEPVAPSAGWKPRSATKSRFEWFAEQAARKAGAAEPEIVGNLEDIPPEELLKLTLEHIKKGGSMKSASDALRLVRQK